jgi:very-short-patch-repair endonuclease
MVERGEVAVLRVAAAQHGCISRTQARNLGLSDRLISKRAASGRWQRLCPAVFRIEGAPRTWRQRLAALLLWGERGSAISHRSAAALHGLARFREGPLELTVTRDVRAPQAHVVHRSTLLSRGDLTAIDDLTVTTIERTLVDLCTAESERDIRASVDEALRRRLTTVRKLRAAVDRSKHHRGIGLLRAIVDELEGGKAPTESELESRVSELLERANLPPAIRQQPLVAGGRVRRLDFHLKGTPVVIECDGYEYHSSPAAFARDRERNNALLARGFKVLHWTWSDVCTKPEALIQQVSEVLGLE